MVSQKHPQKSLRYRVNVKETAKHEKYWECTVDATGFFADDVLTFSDQLVAELEARYPAQVEKEGK